MTSRGERGALGLSPCPEHTCKEARREGVRRASGECAGLGYFQRNLQKPARASARPTIMFLISISIS
jgi:hypothetical protein